jgi:hypothetical protein
MRHLCPRLCLRPQVRQWVLSVPKRQRYFLQRDGAVLNMVLRIFQRVIAQSLHANSPCALSVDKAALHIGAIAFIHRFGSSLNGLEHFKVAWSLDCRDHWTSRKRVFVGVRRCQPAIRRPLYRPVPEREGFFKHRVTGPVAVGKSQAFVTDGVAL